MEKDNLKIWKQIDNELSDKERADFQAELNNNSVLNQQLKDAEKIDEALRQMETEEPSMRFSMNVFEKLPSIYKKVQVSPLFSPRAIKLGILSVGALILVSLAPVLFVEGDYDITYFDFWNSLLQMNFQIPIPSEWVLMLAVASFGFVTYVIIDRQIKKRILKRDFSSKT